MWGLRGCGGLLIQSSLDRLDHGEIGGNAGFGFIALKRCARWADVEGTLGKSLSHHSWKSIKIASHPKVSLGSDQTFHLPPFKACTLRRTREGRQTSVMSVMSVILLCFQLIKHDAGAAGSVMGSVIDLGPRSWE
jgi:hypothetical protein